MARRVFFSFHFERDNWRASQVRSMGVIEGNPPCSDNDWEAIKRGGDSAVKRWIDGQLEGKSCVVVLVGSETAGRPWITYEITEAWNAGKGVVGVRIHNLRDRNQAQAVAGANPFSELHFAKEPSKLLSSVVALHNPPFSDSLRVYAYISKHLATWIEEAIQQRADFMR